MPLLVGAERAEELKKEAVSLASWDLNERQIWDIELLLSGAFTPLAGYHSRADHESVLSGMRLADGALWPIPITLDVTPTFAESIAPGQRVALRHAEGMALAIMTVTDVWEPDLAAEAQAVMGTENEDHPGVFQLRHQTNPVYVGGTLEGVELPPHHTFRHLRHTPLELRAELARLGWRRVLGFQTRNPMHRAHVELARRAAGEIEANLLLHPVVGRTSPGDVDYFSRVRCYQRVLEHFPTNSTMLSLLPLAMRMAGPREALWHAQIRKNYGCTDFVVGRDHAGARDRNGQSFYGPYDAQELVAAHHDELGINVVPIEEMVYCEDVGQYMPKSQVPEKARVLTLSGTELRRRLKEGADVPDWFSYPDVITELRHRFPARANQGYTVFFTGLSGSGKSTIANILVAKLMEVDTRPVTLLDGDIVRKNLSSELGFSKEHRDLNIRRIGFVASEITKNRGVAVCAPIAPYAATRRQVRELIEHYGGFIEVFVATPLEVCEQRDRKGLYAKARAGIIKGMTGIDDPYEEPQNAEMVIDTTAATAEEAAQQVLLHLESEGFIAAED
ncbi:MAG: bifunctional sulfate adenylyltransferase/adenylylsulfate kinase [Acidobacteriota bacterium]|nr:bifunctional sulfate adenylyltransferase/adenylylsulfate kinase [Acidobacteriota bacterium]